MIDVAIDARATKRMSAGVRAYVNALLDGIPRVAPDVRLHPVGHGGNFGLSEQVALPREIARVKPNLVHYPTTFVPMMRRPPYVAMVHDLIHLQFPKLFGIATAAHYSLVAIPMLRGAARLLMSDERTADACVEYLGVPRDRCSVIPLGYDPALLAGEAFAAPRPYVFYAGNHRPHKNLRVLYEAWAALPEPIALDLEVTGPDDPAARAAWKRTSGELRFTGELSFAGLAGRYRGALAYVHPALAEGFGLPMLEALVVGTPVLASSTAVPRLLEPYTHTFRPHDVLALRALLADIAASGAPYRRRAAEGSVAVRAYTWDRFAASTAAVYREVVDESGRA